MKKHMYAIVLFLVISSLLFSLTGCQKTEEPATTQPTIHVRSFNLTHVNSGMFQYEAADFNASGSLELHPEGTAKLYYAGQSISLLYDENNLWSADTPDELHPYRISGMVLVLEYHTDILTFVEK